MLIYVIITYSKHKGNNLLHGTMPLLLRERVVEDIETDCSSFGSPFKKMGLKWLSQVATTPDIIEPLVELKALSLCKCINNTISSVTKYYFH